MKKSKYKSTKLWSFIGLIVLSFILCFAKKVTGEVLFNFWEVIFFGFVGGNVFQKFLFAKYSNKNIGDVNNVS